MTSNSIRAGLLALAIFAAPASSFAQIGISITLAPPELQVEEQPVMPADGYLWTPGYWAYGDIGYYWVPGAWVQPPSVGVLWTPGYWGWSNGVYAFNNGYWGPHIGFYGGVNYGYGYGGDGYSGGRWNNGAFAYNTAVNNVRGVSIRNSYHETVTNNNSATRVSFNGGNGIHAAPTAEQQSFAHENHIAATAQQTQHEQTARANPAQRLSANQGHPAAAETQPASRPAAAATERHVQAPAAARPQAQFRPQSQARPAAQQRPGPQAPRPVAQQQRPQSQGRPAAPQRPQAAQGHESKPREH